jgi:hypothetical protein
MWVIGGGQFVSPGGMLPLNDTWSTVDGVNWTQEVAAAPWSPRIRPACVVHNGRMWVLGGLNLITQEALDDVWSSDDGINWKQELANAPWGVRFSHTATVYGGRIWVIGGSEAGWGAVEYGDVWSSADGVNWRFEGEPWKNEPYTTRSGHTVTVHNGRLYVLGIDAWSYGIHFRGDGELPWGVLDTPYLEALDWRGGEAPYTWTLIDGALPPGLAVGQSAQGMPESIVGVPEEVGNFTFTLRVEEGSGDFIEETFSIRIHATTPFSATSDGDGCVLGSVPPAPGALALLCAVIAILRRRK